MVYSFLTAGGCFTTFPNEKSLDWSEFKAFATDKINVNRKLEFSPGSIEKKNIVETRIFFFHIVFKSSLFHGR